MLPISIIGLGFVDAFFADARAKAASQNYYFR